MCVFTAYKKITIFFVKPMCTFERGCRFRLWISLRWNVVTLRCWSAKIPKKTYFRVERFSNDDDNVDKTWAKEFCTVWNGCMIDEDVLRTINEILLRDVNRNVIFFEENYENNLCWR